MPELPITVSSSKLWARLEGFDLLRNSVRELRATAVAIGAKAAQLVPEFTDHSDKHMDALWKITDVVLTENEIQKMSPGEAFILGCSFYVHDLGMAIGATAEGRKILETSRTYTESYEHQREVEGLSESDASAIAFSTATRDLHGIFALSSIDQKIPGLDRFLIESTDIRAQWGAFIGQVAASHNWSIREVDSKLGARGALPDPIGGRIDLAFVACVLRVVDYAHINSERATSLDRTLRSTMLPTSLIHWQAQENVTGPLRQGDLLEFGATRPIETVAGWWMFFELVRGLDTEIRDVAEYLAQRSASTGRFSLEGVRGTTSPQKFATFVPPNGFEPIDVRLRSNSMDRLVSLLGGKTLYGNDPFAAVRELLQNAADAIRLRWSTDSVGGISPQEGKIDVELDTQQEFAHLTVADDGIGMSERVVTQYLLGVASDYWHSNDFSIDHPGARTHGFRPVGRFGIGFLSVFMLGRDIEVRTQRTGSDELKLELKGVGSRGALTRATPRLRSGTKVKILLDRQVLPHVAALAGAVQERAPMLEIPIVIRTDDATSTLEPGWWKKLSQEDLKRFVLDFPTHGARSRNRAAQLRNLSEVELQARLLLDRVTRGKVDNPLNWWPGSQPELLNGTTRILAVPTSGKVLLCSRGFAIGVVDVPGFLGMHDNPDLQLNAARNRPLELDIAALQEQFRAELMPSILAALDRLNDEPSIHERYEFLVKASSAYGIGVLQNTRMKWISVLEPPGESRLLDPTSFIERVKEEREVIVGYRGTTPWNITSEARRHFPSASPRALKIMVSGVAQSDLRRNEPYHERELQKTLPLAEHLSDYGSTRANTELVNVPLLETVIELLARSWGVSRSELTGRQWSSKSDVLCGHLVR